MSYISTTDFTALLRTTPGGVRVMQMPGLDFVVAALNRAGIYQIWTGQTAPVINQAVTLWFKPAMPSWTAEGIVYLWNSSNGRYEIATPALWRQFVAQIAAPYYFQSITDPVASAVINPAASLFVVNRNAPRATDLTLPVVSIRSGAPLHIADWSVNVVTHAIRLIPQGTSTVMRQTVWTLNSTPDQLSGVTLYPSTELNGWVIAP